MSKKAELRAFVFKIDHPRSVYDLARACKKRDNVSMWFFMRHAESEANVARLLGGQADFPLTDHGKKQAKALALRMKESFPAFQGIVSSPLLRAKQTAEAVNTVFGLDKIVFAEGLKEHHIGRFTAMPYQEAKEQKDYESDVAKRWHWRPKGGESYAEVARRVQRLLYEFLPQRQSHLLFVTHAVTMRLIYAVLKNSLPHYLERVCENGEIWECDFQGLFHTHTIKIHRFPETTAHRP